MTLKEELSIDYQKAMEEGPKKIEPSADVEMRYIITYYIYPIMRFIHNKHRTLKKLQVSVEVHSFFTFCPIPSLYNDYDEKAVKDMYKPYERYIPMEPVNDLISAAYRISEQFDLELTPLDKTGCKFTFIMTLDG